MTVAQYDPLYVAAGAQSGIPAAFIRAIVSRESGGNPKATPKASSSAAARGLMQVTGVVRIDYNRRHATNVQPDDLWDPSTNVRIGSDLLARIVDAYRATGIAGLQPDWKDRRWVELVSLGYGAGYSAGSGVLFVAKALAKEGRAISADSVAAQAATLPGAYAELYRPAKVAWCKGTAAVYFGAPAAPSGPSSGGSGSGVLLLALAVLVAMEAK